MIKKALFIALATSTLLYASITDFKTLQASFKQHIVNEQNQTITYEGTLYIKQPGKILWHYRSPVEKSIYINRKHVTVYEPELYQAIIFDQKKELNPIEVFENSKRIDATTRVSEYNGQTITVNHDGDRVTSIQFKDKVDNQVSIIFTEYEKGKSLKDELFQFEPGVGVDIIRQ